MKIVFFGNICNFAYWYAKWGRLLGYETYALIEKNERFDRDRPEWEDTEYDPTKPPEWVKFYDPGRPIDRLLRGRARIDLERILEPYDAIHTFSLLTSVATGTTSRAFVYHTVGSFGRSATYLKYHCQSLRAMIAPRRFPTIWRFRKALRRCKAIIPSVAYDYLEVKKSRYRDLLRVVPMAYDVQLAQKHVRESVKPVSLGHRTTFLLPARQHWGFKGQNLVLKAISMLSPQERKRSRIVLMAWGRDLQRTEQLTKQLGLTEVIEWSPILTKNELWDACSQPGTVVMDQFPTLDFHGGGLGGVARDAMAVGAVVITHARPETQLWIHKTPPPIWHAECSSRDILRQIRKCLTMTPEELRKSGQRNTEWLLAECSYERVIPRIVKLHEELGA